jgi:MFS family permease
VLSDVRTVPGSGTHAWLGPLVAVILLQTAAAFLLQLLPTTAPVVIQKFGWSESAIGYLMALTMGSAVVCLQGAGSVVRGLGPVRTVQMALLIGGLGAAALAAPVWFAPVVTSLLIGLAYGPTAPAGSDILHRFSPPQHRSLVFSVKQMGVPLGAAGAGIILPWLVTGYGLTAAIACTVLVMITAAALAQPFRRLTDDERSTMLPTGLPTGLPGEETKKLAVVLLPLRLLRQVPGLLCLASVGGCLATVQGVLNTFLMIWMVTALSLDLHTAGFGFAALQAGGIVGRLGFGWLADRVGSGVPVIRISSLGSIAALLGLSLVRPDWPFALLALFFGAVGIVVAGWNGVQLSEIARRTPAGLIGETAAGATSLVFSGLVAGPAIFGLMLARSSRFDVVFAAFALVPAVAFVLSLAVGPARDPILSS